VSHKSRALTEKPASGGESCRLNGHFIDRLVAGDPPKQRRARQILTELDRQRGYTTADAKALTEAREQTIAANKQRGK
jgi:hypothetical protein